MVVPSVAEQLREAREQKKWTIHQVAEATKIKTDHVRALEEGNFSAFAAPVYIRGFVRTYATMLHLDVTRVLGDLDTEIVNSGQFRDYAGQTARKRTALDVLSLLISKLNWTIVLTLAILGLLLALLTWAYHAWQRHQATDPLGELGPGLYQPRQTNFGETLPVPAVSPPPQNRR